ncbi:hypothetical protein KP509_34G067200 [Ceratopteris richardii]|uniref:Bromo domain-containing protein n=1 Tax=Ceratopteris richardii TaxID=49495 RepID=A0A8T2QM22_CERRI|nr:hypothetical protein KP509_34G067200 [Ceratopteris richardii]
MSPVHTRTGGRPGHHHFLRHHLYYPKSKKKDRDRKSASQIAKMIRRGQAVSSAPSTRDTQNQPAANLRRSSRKRRPANHREYISFSDNEDEFETRTYRQSRSGRSETKSSQDEDQAQPRREGLRPRRETRRLRADSPQSFEDDQASSEDDIEDDMGDEEEEEDQDEDEENEDDEREEEREDDEDEEGEGRRRYALRNRTEVQRFSPQHEDRALQTQRSVSKSFSFQTGMKRSRDSKRVSSKTEKRHRSSRDEDSDDSLLIDEIVQSQGPPWLKGGSFSGPPWLLGSLDFSGFQSRGMNAAVTSWGHPGDQLAGGVPTAGLSYKGGADIQPLQVDESITFDQVGGLADYVQSLKEIVFFPLLYPQFFQNYGIKPPRGVLLCGPPGTGKTLIARALAASASRAGQKVNFYMRKGADVLSKWVGEAERQLRMLFEEAQRNQPSIIFFDEIDGLAPVRSSRQEQIHNSIVSTLLALMDGLDSLGQVIVIGATNRVDAIDGALRRPGRFDRELTFSLPDSKAREEILKIHTRPWKEHLDDELYKELAAACVGYCGADLKALCTEAAIGAFRKRYPQVYSSNDSLLIDVASVQVKRLDFLEAMSTITPAAQRGTLVQSMPLSSIVSPCLENQLTVIMNRIARIFPMNKKEGSSKLIASKGDADQLAAFSTLRYGSSFPHVYRPRLLICGKAAAGMEHIGPAVLHELEKFPVHSISLPSLLVDMSSRSCEEAIVNIFREARRTTPSVLYLPQIDLWWDTANSQLRAVLLMLLADLPSNLPVLFLATAKLTQVELEEQVASVFGSSIYEVEYPSSEDRGKFFSQLLEVAINISEQKHIERTKPTFIPELPKAPKLERERSQAQLQAQYEEEQHALRRMRMCFREVCNRLLREKSFAVFYYPVTEEEAPDYHTVVQTPMDISTLLYRTDNGQYLSRSAFLQDLELIPLNAKTYHKDDYNGSRIISKACSLRDAAHAMLSQIDKDLVSQCEKIVARGGPIKLDAKLSGNELAGSFSAPVNVPPSNNSVRVSARLRGVQPGINLSQTGEVHVRRSRRTSEGETAGESEAAASSQTRHISSIDLNIDLSEKAAEDTFSPKSMDVDVSKEFSVQVNADLEKDQQVSAMFTTVADSVRSPKSPDMGGRSQIDLSHEDDIAMDPEHPMATTSASYIEKLKKRFIKRTRGFGVSDLEMIHANVCQTIQRHCATKSRAWVIKVLKKFITGLRGGNSKELNEIIALNGD